VPSLSRRAVLAGGLGLAAGACIAGGYELVQNGTLPGKYQLARLTGACGSAPPFPAGPLPSRHLVAFHSVYRHREVQMLTLLPAGAASPAGLGVVIALHGAGGTGISMARQLAPAMTRAGVSTFAVICVDGGDTYWHQHADGDDPAGMIVHEALPRAAAAGMRTRRIGLVGLSMGGFGALLLAEQFSAAAGAGGRPRVAAVAALSPAIFATYPDARAANAAAFDSPAEFARNDVFTGLGALRRVPTLISCGQDDPFQSETVRVREKLSALTGQRVPGGIMPGCHDGAFWGRTMPGALSFLGQHGA
jgi:pimeloyl-ACP methyl ester carboxylesterase